MHFAAAFLEFKIQSLNALYCESHHGLVADFPCESLVVHAGYVQVCFAAVDTCVGWWSVVAKGFFEAADFCPLA